MSVNGMTGGRVPNRQRSTPSSSANAFSVEYVDVPIPPGRERLQRGDVNADSHVRRPRPFAAKIRLMTHLNDRKRYLSQ